MTVTEKSSSKKIFFWLFLKTMKLENEIKSPFPGGYWTLGDILLSKCKSSFTTLFSWEENKVGAWQVTNIEEKAPHLGSKEYFLFWFIFISL